MADIFQHNANITRLKASGKVDNGDTAKMLCTYHWLAPGIDPWDYQGGCKMHGAKLAISPRGGVTLEDKGPFLNRKYSHDIPVGLSMILQIVTFPPQFIDSEVNLLNFPLHRGVDPIPSPCIPWHIPLVGPWVNPWGKPITCASYFSCVSNYWRDEQRNIKFERHTCWHVGKWGWFFYKVYSYIPFVYNDIFTYLSYYYIQHF